MAPPEVDTNMETLVVSLMLEYRVTPLKMAIYRVLQGSDEAVRGAQIAESIEAGYRHKMTAGQMSTTLDRMTCSGELTKVEIGPQPGRGGGNGVAYELSDHTRKDILPKFDNLSSKS
jgi:hypothetical protein